MAVYVITRIEVTDPVRYENYKALTPEAVAAHDGRFIVRGGEMEVLEGEPEHRRVVVVEFADMDTARRFYDSEEYRAARAAREGAASVQMIVVAGAD